MLCIRSRTFKRASQASGSFLFLKLNDIHLSIYLVPPPENLTHLLEGIQLRLGFPALTAAKTARSCKQNTLRDLHLHQAAIDSDSVLEFRPRPRPFNSHSPVLTRANNSISTPTPLPLARQKLRLPTPRHRRLHNFHFHVDRLLKLAGRTRRMEEDEKLASLPLYTWQLAWQIETNSCRQSVRRVLPILIHSLTRVLGIMN